MLIDITFRKDKSILDVTTDSQPIQSILNSNGNIIHYIFSIYKINVMDIINNKLNSVNSYTQSLNNQKGSYIEAINVTAKKMIISESEYIFKLVLQVANKLIKKNHHKFSQNIVNSISENLINNNINLNSQAFSNLVAGLPGKAVFKVTEEFKYAAFNKNTMDLFGVGENLYGQDDITMSKTFMKNRWSKKLSHGLRDKDMNVLYTQNPIIAQEEEPYLDAKGQIVMHSLTTIPIINGDPNKSGVLIIGMDINPLNKIESLRKEYYKAYALKKKANEMFLKHLGITNYYSENMIPSSTEIDTMMLLAQGLSNKKIAIKLEVSISSIEKKIDSLKMKFNVQHKDEIAEIFNNAIKNLQT